MGEADCQTSYVTQHMDWADAHGVSYLPWGWELWGCANHAYGLLADWSGTPNPYGQAFCNHFAARAATPPPPTGSEAMIRQRSSDHSQLRTVTGRGGRLSDSDFGPISPTFSPSITSPGGQLAEPVAHRLEPRRGGTGLPRCSVTR